MKWFLATLALLTAFHTQAADFENYAREQLANYQVSGAAIAVVENGQVAQIIHVGQADAQTPLSADALFQVGSVSKPVAAWAAMTLVQAGKLDLDTPIDTYLTRWALPSSEFDHSQVTLRRILSHTAGLSLGGYPGFESGTLLPSTEASLSGDTGGSGAVFVQQAPGEAFSYSGGGYTLMQLIIEEVTGQSFADYAKQAVLEPLGMLSSSYEPDAELMQNRVTPHDHNLGAIADHEFRAQAAASLHSTASDIARFALANMQANPVLTEATLNLMHSPVADAFGDQIGLGFFIAHKGLYIGHGGSNLGWKVTLQMAPAQQSAVVVLTNSESGGPYTRDLTCEWDRRWGPGAMQEECTQWRTNREQAKQRYQNIGLALGLAGLALGAFLVLSVLRTKRQWTRPTGARLAVCAVMAALLVIWCAALYTPLGVYLVAGFWSLFPTIDYLAPNFRSLSLGAVVLMLSLLGCTLVRTKQT